MTASVSTPLRLLGGPDLRAGAEGLRSHVARFGPLPERGPALISALEAAGLRGRGGAAFPVATKWRAVAAGAGPGMTVIANGTEGEPLSRKDAVLMSTRPHLVLDGTLLAMRTVGAGSAVVLVAEDQDAVRQALSRALMERSPDVQRAVRLLAAPAHYVAGESSAAVNLLATGYSLPVQAPPRPYERGLNGRPTLVQNVETLAHVALIARYGPDWFRSTGIGGAVGTLLITVHPPGRPASVLEVVAGSSAGDALRAAGTTRQEAGAVLVGGYFGAWVAPSRAWDVALQPEPSLSAGAALGCGVVAALGFHRCGVCVTAQVMRYLAGQSSAQCGPCFFGLRALAETCERIAANRSEPEDQRRLQRWSREVRGRGACHHPDGAAGFLESAVAAFSADFAHHQPHGPQGAWPGAGR